MILINDTHNKAAQLLLHRDESGDMYVTLGQCRRAIEKLCGVENCKCRKITEAYLVPDESDFVHRILDAMSHDDKIYLPTP